MLPNLLKRIKFGTIVQKGDLQNIFDNFLRAVIPFNTKTDEKFTTEHSRVHHFTRQVKNIGRNRRPDEELCQIVRERVTVVIQQVIRRPSATNAKKMQTGNLSCEINKEIRTRGKTNKEAKKRRAFRNREVRKY